MPKLFPMYLLNLRNIKFGMRKKKLVVLSGAGISAESGIKTFRDSDGLWEGHDVMSVASPEGWRKDRKLVLDFYNERRRQLLTCKPNIGHKILADLENEFEVSIITQNIDNLHEAAGSKNVIHLHGELLKARSSSDESYVVDWNEDINDGDFCPNNSQMRPHIVWFGEQVPELERAAEIVAHADILLVVGTSLQVYPAAGLINMAAQTIPIYYIDPKPAPIYGVPNDVVIISEIASTGMEKFREMILKN